MRATPEYQAMVVIKEWVEWNTNLPFIHVPNEGKRSPQYGKRLKDIGWRAGISDIFIPRRTTQYAGLWIELKVGKNKATPAQLAFIADMLREGYQASVIWEAWPCIEFIKQHFGL